MFKIGEEVVCVDDNLSNGIKMEYLTKGNIYTVRWIGMIWHPLGGDQLTVRLEGIERHTDKETAIFFNQPEWADMPFRASRFAPLRKKQTDISVFTAMLTPKKVTEDA